MKAGKRRSFGTRIGVAALTAVLLLFISQAELKAQGPPHPPRPIRVTPTQDLAFGLFYHGAGGGTITVTPVGIRSADNTVVLLPGMLYSQGRFTITGREGTIVTYSFVNPSVLTGVPSGTMSLTINSTDLPASFVLPPGRPNSSVQMNVGGQLTVGGPVANPPGIYSGSFEIIFNQQ